MEHLSPKKYADISSLEKYNVLIDLLASGLWEQANQMTTSLLLALAGREIGDCLWLEDVAKLPLQELQLINYLWLHYSKGRFGFSVQYRIWRKALSLGAYEAECDLGDRVGWRQSDGSWLVYDQITFADSAPRGHLPLALAWWVDGAGIVLGGVGKFWQVIRQSHPSSNSNTTIVCYRPASSMSELFQSPPTSDPL